LQPLVINTPRLFIRNLQPQDAEAFYIYRSNPEVVRYQSFDVMTKEEAVEFIEQYKDKQFGAPGEWVQYAIVNKTTGLLAGDCAIRIGETDTTQAEVGITISHLHQKQGYAKEVFAGILRFLFETIHIRRVVEIVDAENVSSIRLLQKCGFRLEALFVENCWFKGKWGSEYQYAMLRHEWEGMQPEK
jgi:[ribosomal protein S5]-alanine N-acetyltransferase